MQTSGQVGCQSAKRHFEARPFFRQKALPNHYRFGGLAIAQNKKQNTVCRITTYVLTWVRRYIQQHTIITTVLLLLLLLFVFILVTPNLTDTCCTHINSPSSCLAFGIFACSVYSSRSSALEFEQQIIHGCSLNRIYTLSTYIHTQVFCFGTCISPNLHVPTTTTEPKPAHQHQ